jgi:hypothetical protein
MAQLADERAQAAFFSVENLVMNDDALRPQDTTAFKKNWQQYTFDFPNIHLSQAPPMFSQEVFPTSTRAAVDNQLFNQRYGTPPVSFSG